MIGCTGGCCKDVDCKGDRICENKKCVLPKPAKPSKFRIIYLDNRRLRLNKFGVFGQLQTIFHIFGLETGLFCCKEKGVLDECSGYCEKAETVGNRQWKQTGKCEKWFEAIRKCREGTNQKLNWEH